MGRIVRISCESCGTEWDCRTGCGITHGILENVAPLFPEDMGNALMEYAGHNECPMYDFEFQPAVCGSCTGIVSVPVLRLHDGDVRYTGLCPDCGKKARPIRNIQKTHCPVCGNRTLKMAETGRWD